jgi:hypothetical protein
MQAWSSSTGISLLSPIILVALAFMALWLMLLYYMSETGGWSRLAEKHRLPERFCGQKWRFCTAIFKDEVRYKGVMTVGASERGLYLALLAPFSCYHPPVLIPWQFVRKSASGRRRQWGATLELGDSPSVQINISVSLLRLLEQRAPGALLKST